MRKITTLARAAFLAGTSFKLDNTAVSSAIVEDCIRHTGKQARRTTLALHGHCIATHTTNDHEAVTFSLCGWNTPTTRERLHAAGVFVGTKKGAPFLHGVETPGGFLRRETPFPLDSAKTYRVNLFTGRVSVVA